MGFRSPNRSTARPSICILTDSITVRFYICGDNGILFSANGSIKAFRHDMCHRKLCTLRLGYSCLVYMHGMPRKSTHKIQNNNGKPSKPLANTAHRAQRTHEKSFSVLCLPFEFPFATETMLLQQHMHHHRSGDHSKERCSQKSETDRWTDSVKAENGKCQIDKTK